jgi:hypothetical protein
MGTKSVLRQSLTTGLLLGLAAAAGFAAQAPIDRERAKALAAADLARQASELGLAAADVADFAVTDVVPTRHNGLTHVYLRQRVNGLEILGAEMNLSFKRDGQTFTRVGAFVPNVAARAAEAGSEPGLTVDEAIASAASALGLADVYRLDVLSTTPGIDRAVVLSNPEVSELPIPARLRYYRVPDSDRLYLVWNLSIKMPADSGSSDWWDLSIDAATGEIVGRANWTAEATYRVFPSPNESPDNTAGVRSDLVNPDLLGGTASPFGWHDTNGVAGPEFTVTNGNNVTACSDFDLPADSCDPGSQPDGTGTLDFTTVAPLSLSDPPQNYELAAVLNLFYWNNIMHDVTYQYGFDEPGGNFQVNNYGNGGLGNDAVNADAQDNSGTNNANFGTPPDGSRPRMQMFVWNAPQNIHENSPTVTDYAAGAATNGASPPFWGFTPPFSVTNDLVYINDAQGPDPNDACCSTADGRCATAQAWGVTGKIALVRRGNCEFGAKAANAQDAGAIGTIIINNGSNGVAGMAAGVYGSLVTTPVQMIGKANGNLIVAEIQLPSTVNVTMSSVAALPNRDSDLDAGVIAHEYGHGVSNRLTGGPSNTSCLQNVEQAGEGWSDWQTLFLHAEASDTRTTERSVGGYVTFEPVNTAGYIGIRRYPYTTDNIVNPLTYAGVADTANTQPHGIGTIWATMLWEMYWNLVDIDGYDSDIYYGTGGNNVAYQLVLDGMKLQPCSPSFVSGRDAILAADVADYDGDHECALWTAFAERGLGTAASTGASSNDRIVTQDFTLPTQCQSNYIFSSSFGHGDFSHWSSSVP